jgi:hypothetical protein
MDLQLLNKMKRHQIAAFSFYLIITIFTIVYTNEFISELVSCEKKIISPPYKELKSERGSLRNNFTLSSIDEKYNFNVFIRQLISFPENFSVGLIHNPKDEKGTIDLLRCNGMHGGTLAFPHHAFFHIHHASEDRITKGLKPEGDIEQTTEYSTLEQAIQYFINKINLTKKDIDKYFPAPKEPPLSLFSN